MRAREWGLGYRRIIESCFIAMLHGVPWFLLGSLWAVLYCEYRAFRRRLKLAAHIRVLESELSASEEYFASEKHHQDRLRAELLDLLAAVKHSGARRRPLN